MDIIQGIEDEIQNVINDSEKQVEDIFIEQCRKIDLINEEKKRRVDFLLNEKDKVLVYLSFMGRLVCHDVGLGYFNSLPNEIIEYILLISSTEHKDGKRYSQLYTTCKFFCWHIDVIAIEKFKTRVGTDVNIDFILNKYPKKYDIWKQILDDNHKYIIKGDRICKQIVGNGCMSIKHCSGPISYRMFDSLIVNDDVIMSLDLGKHKLIVVHGTNYYMFENCSAIKVKLGYTILIKNNPKFIKLMKTTSLYKYSRDEIFETPGMRYSRASE